MGIGYTATHVQGVVSQIFDFFKQLSENILPNQKFALKYQEVVGTWAARKVRQYHVIMATELVNQWFGMSSTGVTRKYTSNSGQWQNSEGAKL
jgi:hypothetical protein